jgi:NADP-dependent aldehyde dehydrogenase
VAVFTASNFPLAFSVAGGDTISALAAKNPVIVKTHPNHPGSSEMMAQAIRSAVEEANMPEGIFSMVHGITANVGLILVRHPLTRAMAFTGSLSAGRALFDAAVSRPEPIPVYAEMGSINPVFILPHALMHMAEPLAQQLATSITLGAGQFCTNPGLIVLIKGEGCDGFIKTLAETVTGQEVGHMLTTAIFEGYQNMLDKYLQVAEVDTVAVSDPRADPRFKCPAAAVLKTNGRTYLENRQLSREIFGPATLVVECESVEEMREIAHSLEGQITATINGNAEDMDVARVILPLLEQRAGRLLWGGTPTGVEVCPSMHHGGPYPASTNCQSTSVGSLAIKRFVKPICYQNFPQELLPVELQNGNYKAIWRLVDDQLTRDNCPAYY